DQGPTAARPDAAGAAPRPPNIVLILADDLGYNDISLHSQRLADTPGGMPLTPNIDTLASAGVQFTHGYAAHSSCAPSRAALLSGRYGTRFGFEFTPIPNAMGRIVSTLHDRDPRNLHPMYRPPEVADESPLPFQEMVMPGSEITLAEVLQARGYHTVHIGKWHLGDTPAARPRAQGFDESLDMASGKYLPDDDPQSVNAYQPFDPIDQFLWANFRHAARWDGGSRFRPNGYLTDYFTDEAVAAIAANRHRPFFLYLAHWAPHTPLQALKADYDALANITDHRTRVYAAMIRALDRSVGRVMSALAARGLDRNTLVIFTSDNGGAGYIGLPDINRPFRGWKLTFFEGGIRVPFLMRWPDAIPAGTRVADPVHHFDIFATAAAAAGAELPGDREIDGVNLLPWATHSAVSDTDNSSDTRSDAGLDKPPHEALFWRNGHYQAVRSGRWKLQRADRPSTTWLYDLANDPTEQRNLATDEPARVAALTARLDRHNAGQAAPAWPSLGELPVLIDKTLADVQRPEDAYVYAPN
ncbi:MAG: sulfatase-like hydrolase/transferase, partial [Gammaproteobacteria bacterium]